MHSLFEKYGYKVPSLYVKSAPTTYHIRMVFVQARIMAPCLLIFEDIDTIVTPATRSYFFNEVDGLENNDGLFMVASTNHLDQLDPGLSSRPSRFDRKYLFPLPSEQERVLYCEYWREKLKSKPGIKFPKKLSRAIAGITEDFSFAYLKEAFVATLLVIAGRRSEDGARGGGDDEGGDLDDYELWREMKKQVKQLRDDMDTRSIVEKMASFDGLESGTLRKITDQPRDSNESSAITGQTELSPQLLSQGLQNMDELRKSGEVSTTTAGRPVQSSQIFGQGLDNPKTATTGAGPNFGTHLNCDIQHAPLMTDNGMFMDSRFNGLGNSGHVA